VLPFCWPPPLYAVVLLAETDPSPARVVEAALRSAAPNGRSVDAEARVILEDAIAVGEDFVSWWREEMVSVPPSEPLPCRRRLGPARQ
jgi:hypothetical protein